MSASCYEDVLYPFQDQALAVIQGIDTGFYLTGGTAASRGYLNHRFSDDLDFFVNDSSDFILWADRVAQGLAREEGWETQVILREERFVRLLLVRPEGSLKIEMVNDVPSHVGILKEHPTLGRLDSAENILANKLSAVVDREEPKDLADIWGFCCRMQLSLAKALEGARSKAAGLFPADVARLLVHATEEDWRLIRWIDPPDPSEFARDLRALGEELLLIPEGDA
jgi:hypothetical protein